MVLAVDFTSFPAFRALFPAPAPAAAGAPRAPPLVYANYRVFSFTDMAHRPFEARRRPRDPPAPSWELRFAGASTPQPRRCA